MTSLRPRFGALLLLVVMVIGGGCHNSSSSDSSGASSSSAAEFGGLDKLAVNPSAPVSQVIGTEGATLNIPSGGKVIVPSGVFQNPTTLEVSTADLNLAALAFDVKEARAFVISTVNETGKLSSPVVLEIPKPSASVTVLELTDGNWQVRKLPPGPTARIEIGHFSKSVFGIVEWFSAQSLKLNQTLEEADNSKDPIKFERTKIERAADGVKSFYGVGENGGRSMHENCTELQTMLSELTDLKQFELPENAGIGLNDLGLFLHSADVPKAHGGPCYELVQASHKTIHQAVISQNGQFAPAAFLKICIDANGGNVPLGVLAAHNYLKDITYRGRDSYDGGKGMPVDCAEAAKHLRSWRPDSNIAEGGYYDKMGPIYHLFAAMTADLWGGKLLGAAAVNGEAFLRSARIGADKPDMAKEQADVCGADIGSWIRNRPSSETPPVSPPTTKSDSFTGRWVGDAHLVAKVKLPAEPWDLRISHTGDRWIIDQGDITFDSTNRDCRMKIDASHLTVESSFVDPSSSDPTPTIFKLVADANGSQLSGYETCEQGPTQLWRKEFTLTRQVK